MAEDLFVVSAVALAVVGSVVLFFVYCFNRTLFIKPSVQFLALLNIFFEWPFAISARVWYLYWPNPFIILIYLLITVLGLLMLSLITFRASAKWVFEGGALGGADGGHEMWRLRWYSNFLAGLMVGVAAIYLFFTPIGSTGLYAIFFDPYSATQAREESLKLIDNDFARYLYSLSASSVAPLLAACAYVRISSSRYLGERFYGLILIFISLLFVSLPGARGPAVMVLSSVFLTHLIRKKFRASVLFPLALILIFAMLVITILMTMFREGLGVAQMQDNITLYAAALARRAFVVPFETAGWHFHFAQKFGFVGIAGVPKMAALISVQPMNVPNLIAHQYLPVFYPEINVIETASAGTSYVASYYTYFGFWAVPIVVFSVIIIDSYLLVIRGLRNIFVAPMLGAATVPLFGMLQGDFTTAFLSHGFLGLFFLAILTKVRVVAGKRVELKEKYC